jgi:hypothetical protein
VKIYRRKLVSLFAGLGENCLYRGVIILIDIAV